MNVFSTLLSRHLKPLSRAVQILAGLVLTAWGVLALGWIVLHQVIVPRIGEFRPLLEARATQVLGVPVRIGAVVARSTGLLPTIELRDVALIDDQGRTALALPRVLAVLSPRALWNYGFEQVVVEQPGLDIRRNAAGRITVAGLDMARGAEAEAGAADWFFAQTEFIIRDGTVRWTDERRPDAPTVTLERVDFVMRNTLRRHQLRLDATPPPAWGERFSVRGAFAEPLWLVSPDRWRGWHGQAYVEFPKVDVAQLRRHADLGLDLVSGQGTLRAWVDLAEARITGGVADVALADVDARLGRRLPALGLSTVTGRLGGRLQTDGFELFTQGLQFRTSDGLVWPGGNASLRYSEASGSRPAQGQFSGDTLDLAALADIGQRLPLGKEAHAALTAYAPTGVVETVQATWQGNLPALKQLQASGKVRGLGLAPEVLPASPSTPPVLGRPGLQGAQLSFELTHTGGQASLRMDGGWLDFPGVFEEARVPFDRLAADVNWRLDGPRIALQVAQLSFANADAEGQAQARWQTGEGAQPRFPGVLDLQGSLSRADGTRVHRYLPTGIPKPVRDYVREAIRQGRASAVSFKARGAIHDMPARDAAAGEFRIAAQLQDVVYDYVPPSLADADGARWPALTQLRGELVFDHASMAVHKARARFAGAPNLELQGIEAKIPDLGHQPVVAVSTSARGAVGELLGLVKTSPLNRMTSQALARATASGNADYKLKLTLPLDSLQASKVQGSVVLAGNELQVTPDTPVLSKLQGVLNFSDTGFTVPQAQARMLGGDIRFEGGLTQPANRPAAPEAVLQFRGQGTVTAEGLRQASELGPLAKLAQQLSGSTSYSAVFGVRRGQPELSVSSTLQGLASSLPAPFTKPAESSVPLRFESALLRESMAPGQLLRDQLSLEIGSLASARYLRDVSGAAPVVMRGSLGVGLAAGELPPAEDGTVAARLQLDTLDVAAWERLLDSVAVSPAASASGEGAAYLPETVALRAKTLLLEGQRLNNLVVGGSREGGVWRANVDASELNGYVEYRPSGGRAAGRVYARLARLKMASAVANEVEHILDRQPQSIPALDVVVDDLELQGRKLGRVQVDAVNVVRDGGGREWQLRELSLTVPEATLAARGSWASSGARGGAPRSDRRETRMVFTLDVTDAGELLKRFGMPGVLQRGKGQLEGQVAWMGSPQAIDHPSLSGDLNLRMESGQFLKADPGLAKLLGVLSLQSLPRRLTLDFRDVFSDGFAYDFIRGDVRIQQGVATTNNLQMKGVNAAVLMEGTADIDKETQDIRAVVVPEINAGTASLVAAVINPAVGIGTFLAQIFLRQPVIEAATQEFHIEGRWDDPKITKVDRKPRVAP